MLAAITFRKTTCFIMPDLSNSWYVKKQPFLMSQRKLTFVYTEEVSSDCSLEFNSTFQQVCIRDKDYKLTTRKVATKYLFVSSVTSCLAFTLKVFAWYLKLPMH